MSKVLGLQMSTTMPDLLVSLEGEGLGLGCASLVKHLANIHETLSVRTPQHHKNRIGKGVALLLLSLSQACADSHCINRICV